MGERKAELAAAGSPPWSKGCYFLGKVLWAKGYTELLDRLREHATRTGVNLNVDVFGSGPDLGVSRGLLTFYVFLCWGSSRQLRAAGYFFHNS